MAEQSRPDNTAPPGELIARLRHISSALRHIGIEAEWSAINARRDAGAFGDGSLGEAVAEFAGHLGHTLNLAADQLSEETQFLEALQRTVAEAAGREHAAPEEVAEHERRSQDHGQQTGKGARGER